MIVRHNSTHHFSVVYNKLFIENLMPWLPVLSWNNDPVIRDQHESHD